MSNLLSLKLSRLRELQEELNKNHKKNQQLMESISFDNNLKIDSDLVQFNLTAFDSNKDSEDIDLIDFTEDMSVESGRCASNLSPIVEEDIFFNDNDNKNKETLLNNSINMSTSKRAKNSKSHNIDDLPVTPGVDGNKVKDFEELVEKSIEEPSTLLIDISNSHSKRPYLKKGSGLVRFRFKNLLISDNKKETLNSQSNQKEKPKQVSITAVNTKEPQKIKNVLQTNSLNMQNKSINKTPTIPSNQIKLFKKSRKVTFPNDNDENNQSKIASLTPPQVPLVERHVYFKNNLNEITLFDESDFVKGNIDKVEMLEKVLEAIQLKKQKLKEEFEQDMLNHESDWEDEKNESGFVKSASSYCRKKVYKKPKNRKKVIKTEFKSPTNESSTSNFFLNLTRESEYAIAVRNKIEGLEQRLQSLRDKCFQKVQIKDISNENKEIEDEKFTSQKIFQEMVNIKDQLNLVHDKLQLLELTNAQKIVKDSIPPSNKKKLTSKNLVEKHFDSTSDIKEIKVSENIQHVIFKNGDEMKRISDNTVIYIYANGTKQTTYPDGLKIIEFPNGQLEKVHSNGVKHIHYLNNTERILYPNGSEETVTSDGTIVRLTSDGKEIVELANGEREIRASEYKRREYSNGTVKTLYSNGVEETRYPNGRLRIKDKNGKLIADSVIKYLQDLVPL